MAVGLWRLAVGRAELGSFRKIQAIGNRHEAIGGGNWVRFAELGGGGTRLGLFCIIRPDGSGEILNPKLEILNKHEIRNSKLET